MVSANRDSGTFGAVDGRDCASALPAASETTAIRVGTNRDMAVSLPKGQMNTVFDGARLGKFRARSDVGAGGGMGAKKNAGRVFSAAGIARKVGRGASRTGPGFHARVSSRQATVRVSRSGAPSRCVYA